MMSALREDDIPTRNPDRERWWLLGLALGAMVALGISPRDRADWAMELVVPALEVAACIVAARWFSFTRLAAWPLFSRWHDKQMGLPAA